VPAYRYGISLLNMFIILLSSVRLISAQVELVAGGFQFVEGPLWNDGVLLFSDINANAIYRWKPDSGSTIYYSPSGNANGLAWDLNGNLLMAQQGKRQLARLEANGTEITLAAEYEGKKLNSPNDIAVKSDGSIFFTDPPYGINSNQEELHFYGIYRISPSGSLQLLDKTLNRPNGIVFSPDETKLYVSDSETRRIYIWDVFADTLIVNKRQFAFINVTGYADGMKVDAQGRLFAAGPLGIWVYDVSGAILDTILVPGQTTNCNWGDADRKMLYITSGSAVYRVRPVYTYLPEPKQGQLDTKILHLYGNYPNPFNSTTQILFYISKPGQVKINIFNLLGENITTLINQSFPSGRHLVSWRTDNISTGMYYIYMTSNEGSDLKKCMLLK
jgi:gluconolactonase